MNNTYTTFKTEEEEGVLTVTFDYPPINVLGIPMLDDLDALVKELQDNRDIKVIVFQSAHPEIFIAHADIHFLKDLPTEVVPRDKVERLYLQDVLQRISELPQASIAKIEGFARGGGHEFALACDMRFASKTKAKFMQMEVGMGILPCGGGASRMARQAGLGRALEIILSGRDFDALEAEAYGTINKAFDDEELTVYVNKLARRIAHFPAESIAICKRMVHRSIDLCIHDALLQEAFELYQATSQTPAVKRFTEADRTGFQNDMENQRQFQARLIDIQEIK